MKIKFETKRIWGNKNIKEDLYREEILEVRNFEAAKDCYIPSDGGIIYKIKADDDSKFVIHYKHLNNEKVEWIDIVKLFVI